MENPLKDLSTKKFLIFHLIFLTIGFGSLFIPFTLSIGLRFFILVLVYNLIILIIVLLKIRSLFKVWLLSFSLSVLMVFPDWILADVLGILVFPELEGLMIGPVPVYMALLWTIPINLILFGTFKLGDMKTSSLVFRNILATLAFLVSSEFYSHLIGTWRAENVSLVLGAAIYILPAEFAYGLAILYAMKSIEKQSYWKTLLWAVIIMIFYIGAATFFYFVVEIIF